MMCQNLPYRPQNAPICFGHANHFAHVPYPAVDNAHRCLDLEHMETFVVQKHLMNSTSTVKVFNNEEDAVNYIRHKKANHTSMPVPEDVKDMDNLVGAVSFYNNNDEPVVYTITHMNHAQPSRRSSVNASSYVPYVRADNKVPGTPVIDGIYIEKERDRGYHCRVAKGVETGP